MNSFGLFLAVRPDAVETTWLSGAWSAGGDSRMYKNFEYNIYGKVRIATHPAYSGSEFFENASKRVSSSDLYETVLMDIEASRFDLELNPSSNIDELSELLPDYSKGQILESLGESIGEVIKEEIDWASLRLISSISGPITNNSTYLTAHAFLLVDDFYGFSQLVNEELASQGVFAATHNYPFAQIAQDGVMELRLRSPIEQIPFAHFRYFGSQAAPVYLWLVKRDYIGKITIPTPVGGTDERPIRSYSVIPDSKIQRDHALHINRMRIVRNSLAWAGSECTKILEFLPEELVDSNLHLEERVEKHLESWEQLSLVRSTQLLLRDFVIHERDIDVYTDYHDTNLNKEKIEQLLRVLDQRLDGLEKTVQTQLTFDREELHARKQERFNRAAVVLGILVIGEIVSSFLAWFFPPCDQQGVFFWVVFLAAIPMALGIYLLLERIYYTKD